MSLPHHIWPSWSLLLVHSNKTVYSHLVPPDKVIPRQKSSQKKLFCMLIWESETCGQLLFGGKKSNCGTSCEKLAVSSFLYKDGEIIAVCSWCVWNQTKLRQAGPSVIISKAYFAALLLALFSSSAQQNGTSSSSSSVFGRQHQLQSLLYSFHTDTVSFLGVKVLPHAFIVINRKIQNKNICTFIKAN